MVSLLLEWLLGPPENRGDRLTGVDICNYIGKFTKKFLTGKTKSYFETEVLNIERDENGRWRLNVEELPTKSFKAITFSHIILATGGCSNPKIRAEISQSAADKAQFRGILPSLLSTTRSLKL